MTATAASTSRDALDDKVKVRLVGNTDVAECINFGSKSPRIADDDVHAFVRFASNTTSIAAIRPQFVMSAINDH